MKVVDYKLYRYSLPLKAPLKLKPDTFNSREGLIVQLTDELGYNGFGEIAPLPGFSSESLSDAQKAIFETCESLINFMMPSDLHRCDGCFLKLLGNLPPSVSFGVESALLELEASKQGLKLCKLLNHSHRQTVYINGLLSGEEVQIIKRAKELKISGYKAAKLKVGLRSMDEEVTITEQVRQSIGKSMQLRLDANRSWNLQESLEFSNRVVDCNIDYLEEPITDTRALLSALQQGDFPVPIAIDETLTEIFPAELSEFDAVEAVVIKPTFLGFEKSVRFARQAKSLGIKPVFSSAFESGCGLSIIAQLAAALIPEDTPAGLDTIHIFADDNNEGFFKIMNGLTSMEDVSDSESLLNSHHLKEVSGNE